MATNRPQIRYGSSGDDVKELQKQLNANGYNLSVDGIWGKNTESAVRDYQKKNNLAVDGIVGKNTWGSLLGSTASSNVTTPKKATTEADTGFSFDDFEYNQYTESDSVKEAGNQKTDAEKALANYGDFNYSNQQSLDDIINKILNREEFSYELNGDALYQQYKDKYIQQGKLAMQDTMGQASAMTGGYGNSYASTAGNQAYQASLENLNDIVPELYQMAYDKYNQEGQDMLNQYSMLSDDRATQYGEWTDGYNRLATDRNYYSDQYNAERNYDYSKYADDRDFSYGQYADDRNLAYTEHRNQIADEQWKTEFDEALRQYNEQMAYQKERDAVADSQWQAQFDESKRQYDNSLSYKKESDTKNYVAGGYGYNNGDVSSADIKAMQEALGVSADGKWGQASMQAAGGLSADEAYEAWVNGELGSYEMVDTQGTKNFHAGIRTRAEFSRQDGGVEVDGRKYTTYEGYLDATLEKWYKEGKLTEEEVATLMSYYGL